MYQDQSNTGGGGGGDREIKAILLLPCKLRTCTDTQYYAIHHTQYFSCPDEVFVTFEDVCTHNYIILL